MPARPHGPSASASTRFGGGIATVGSARAATPPTVASCPQEEIDRLRGRPVDELSARNRFRGIVRDVQVDGLLAQVEIDVTEPTRVVAIVTSEAARALGLKPGDSATAVVKSTSVMVEH